MMFASESFKLSRRVGPYAAGESLSLVTCRGGHRVRVTPGHGPFPLRLSLSLGVTHSSTQCQCCGQPEPELRGGAVASHCQPECQ
eukprot:1953039-Rhodomonas_salina.3